MINRHTSWVFCKDCNGQGKKRGRIKKNARIRHQKEIKTNNSSTPSILKAPLTPCVCCSGSGIIPAETPPLPDHKNYPHVAIIGGGIGGVALAVACLHRGIPFTLYERDANFNARSQGYGLTLQQASKAMEGFGISSLQEGIVSTKHLVHTPDGKVIGEWGMRKWLSAEVKHIPKRTNIHIARQSLRLALLQQLNNSKHIQWGHQLIDFKEKKNEGVSLTFKVDGKLETHNTSLLVGADGIRSAVRNLLIGETESPLCYLGCIVILGICALSDLENTESALLDMATVFQTANGNERIYVMPYASNTVMWQLSFPMSEKEAKALSEKGAKALKEEACRRTPWHQPIPQILAATKESLISGYPVYDRALLQPNQLQKAQQITLLGDAAHPMSPFKGQGANQALLDALSLAREITKGCTAFSQWREKGIRESVLNSFEEEMLERSATKVKDSAAAAKFLHSETVLHEGNETRGTMFKKQHTEK